MPRPFAIDRLSSEAQLVMVACFQERMPAAAIVLKIKAETGEDVAERTIGRRKAEWEENMRRRKAGREQMEDLLAAMRTGDHTASEMVNALAIEQLMRDPDGTLTADPIELQRTSIAAERVRLQRERQALLLRQIELEEKKFQAVQDREIRAIAELRGGEAKKLTAEEMLRKVRDIYGLKNDEDTRNSAS